MSITRTNNHGLIVARPGGNPEITENTVRTLLREVRALREVVTVLRAEVIKTNKRVIALEAPTPDAI
jgi:hypothetical protein